MPMEIVYKGKKRFQAKTRGLELISDQPVEEGGDNLGFTPPELLIASLGSCIGVYIESFAERHGVDITGLTINLEWEKVAKPARIGKIRCWIKIPTVIDEQMAAALLRVAEQCLIHNTLTQAPEIKVEIERKG